MENPLRLMNLPVRSHDKQLEFSVALTPFIADWAGASQKFISGLAERFDTIVLAEDFNVNLSNSLGDMSCRCRLFGGACLITLTPNELRLTFKNVSYAAYPAVFSTMRSTLGWLASDFGSHKQDTLYFRCNEHVHSDDEQSVDEYLNQFAHDKILEALESEAAVSYQPSIRIALIGTKKNWSLQRLVEKSLQFNDELFVSTNVSILLRDAEDTDNLDRIISGLSDVADKAVGLNRGEG